MPSVAVTTAAEPEPTQLGGTIDLATVRFTDATWGEAATASEMTAAVGRLPYAIKVPSSFNYFSGSGSGFVHWMNGTENIEKRNGLRIVLCAADGYSAQLSSCDWISHSAIGITYNVNWNFQTESAFEEDVYSCSDDCASAKQSAQPIQGAQVSVPVAFGPVSVWSEEDKSAWTEFQDKSGNVLTVSVGADSQEEAAGMLSQISVVAR